MANKHYLDEILDEKEQGLLQVFVNNPDLVDTVKKVLLAGLYQNGTLRKGKNPSALYNTAFGLVSGAGKETSNEQIGADLRALWEGLNHLESAFNTMLDYKKPDINAEPRSNNAR